ncbi:hypothetical protein STEG23_029249 [Scotinomys teguina]
MTTDTLTERQDLHVVDFFVVVVKAKNSMSFESLLLPKEKHFSLDSVKSLKRDEVQVERHTVQSDDGEDPVKQPS